MEFRNAEFYTPPDLYDYGYTQFILSKIKASKDVNFVKHPNP